VSLPRSLAFLLVPLLLSGCSSHQLTPPTVSVPPPARYQQAPEDASSEIERDPWWLAFQDNELSEMIQIALAHNLDLQAAWARLSQSGSSRRQISSREQPTGTLSATNSQTQFFFPGRGPVSNDRSAILAPLSWEVDLFGKLNSGSSAARSEAHASRSDLEAFALFLSAEIATSYFGLLEQRARHSLLQAQLVTNSDLLESLRARFTQGQSSSLDYYQQEQLVQGRRAQLHLIVAEQTRQENRLAVLLGQAPGGLPLPERKDLPALPAMPGLGFPSSLLERRPDLRAAFHHIRAADLRVAEAVKDQLPVIRLGTTFSYQASDPSGLFRKLLRGISAGLELPFLDGGRRRAQITQRKSQLAELLHRYSQTFLLALEEVETTLAQERQQQKYLKELEAQEATAQRSFDIAKARYQEGVEDFLRVLTSLSSLQQVQDALVQGRSKLLAMRVRLCRALGGSWMQHLTEETSS
jgi:NodT family efflux transporter outer membrane factor (OMF) lipoprotein